MIKPSTVALLEREIQRTINHLNGLKDLLEELLAEEDYTKRRTANPGTIDRRALVEEALTRVRTNRTFSVKEVTGYARRIDPDVDRRLIYNCIKNYLLTGVKKGQFEQVDKNEYRRN
ncbi:hypothetical protein FACS1894206_06870 [Deltaproteobacteria bacterium]|nr:hypothetical protein FACS1894206_06870 [Deltaproteobacteria bacterium]